MANTQAVATRRERLSQEARELSVVAECLRDNIHVRDLRSGRWFAKMLTAYVALREERFEHVATPADDDARDRASQATMRRAAWLTSISGAGAAASLTAGSLVSSETGGLASPFAMPLAGAAVAAELVFRSLIHLSMICDLGELHGMSFTPGNEAELVGVYALSFGIEMHETEDDPGRGLVERLIQHQDSSGLGKLVASGLVGETLLRNVIPFADIAVSSIGNWNLTKKVGQFTREYAWRRVALRKAMEGLRRRSPASVDLLLEGAWFIFIADGRLTGVEASLLAHFLRCEPEKAAFTARFVDDQTEWLGRLREMEKDPAARDLLLEGLAVAAVVEGDVDAEETAIIRSAATALERPLPGAVPSMRPAQAN